MVEIPQIKRIPVHRVKFRKACELNVKCREACVLKVKYQNFSFLNYLSHFHTFSLVHLYLKPCHFSLFFHMSFRLRISRLYTCVYLSAQLDPFSLEQKDQELRLEIVGEIFFFNLVKSSRSRVRFWKLLEMLYKGYLACRSCNFVRSTSNPGPQFRVASWRPGLLLGRHLPVRAATEQTSNAHVDRPFDPGKGLARLTVDQLWLSSSACLPGYVRIVGCNRASAIAKGKMQR